MADAAERICVHCGKAVAPDRARLCDHCGLPFAGELPPPAVRRPPGGKGNTALAVGCLVLGFGGALFIGFVAWMTSLIDGSDQTGLVVLAALLAAGGVIAMARLWRH